jgi:WD40 repeat protein
LAAACEDDRIHFFDIESKKRLATAEHRGFVASMGWRRQGQVLVAQSSTLVSAYDARSGRVLCSIHEDGRSRSSFESNTISRDGRVVVVSGDSMLRLYNTEGGQLLRTLLCLRDQKYGVISPDGHFSGSPGVEREFVYVVQTDSGQETLTPEEFARKYGWKNDPSKLRAGDGQVGR